MRYLIIALLFFSSCNLKIKSINGIKYEESYSYLSVGKENVLETKGIFVKLDSISKGSFIRKDKHRYLVEVFDSIRPYPVIVYSSTKSSKKIDSSIVLVSRPPDLKLKLFPSDLGDSLHFDNLRFLNYKLVSDSSSFERVRKYIDIIYIRLDSIAYRIPNGGFPLGILDKIFTNRYKKLYIDSVEYTTNGNTITSVTDRSFILSYPKENLYRRLDEINSGFWNSSFESLVNFHLSKGKFNKYLVGTIVRGGHDMENVTPLYSNHFFMNLGGLAGVNHFIVKDKVGNVIYDRVIDGENHRIEDLLDTYGYDELLIEVNGHYHWKITIKYV